MSTTTTDRLIPPPFLYGGATFPPPYTDTSPPPPEPQSSSPSIIIITVVLTLAIITSAIIYLRRKHLSKQHHSSSNLSTTNNNNVAVLHREASTTNRHVSPNILDSLPIFTFRSLTGNLTGDGDCAVCLSKFKPNDKLRLLPLCCHAFHATCIDTWIVSNQTCPLCRSTVVFDDSISSSTDNRLNNNVNGNNNDGTSNNNSSSSSSDSFRSDQRNMSRGRSFRVEIGSVSTAANAAAAEGALRSYSIGNGSSSFEYVLEGNGYEVYVVDKDYEVCGGGGRSLLMEYLERLTSISMSSRSTSSSFRSSGRFFSFGSSRRTVGGGDLEANRAAGEEISEMFRWLSEI